MGLSHSGGVIIRRADEDDTTPSTIGHYISRGSGQISLIWAALESIPDFPSFLHFSAERSKCGNAALTVIQEPIRSMSMTALNALSDNSETLAKKFPAAPALGRSKRSAMHARVVDVQRVEITCITKSIPPRRLTHSSTAAFTLSGFRTSTSPMPRTMLPVLTADISAATSSALVRFRPTTHAFAPRYTRART